MLVEKFISDISTETGYKLGSPWRYSDKSLGVIVPILKTGNIEERDYITIEEVKGQGVEFKDSGHIDKVIIKSSVSKPIFIRSGTILKSQGTQPRAVESSIVVMPQEENGKPGEQEIQVRCIHASKGIHAGTKFVYGGDVPLEVRSALLSRSGQSGTWDAVKGVTHRFAAYRLSSHAYGQSYGRSNRIGLGSFAASNDNLVGIMEEVDQFTGNIDEILKKVPLFEDQVGAAFLDLKDVVGIELFDAPKSWEAIHKEVEKRLGESVTKEEEKTFFKPDYEQVKPLIFQFLKKLIDSEKIETFKGGDIYSVTLLKGSDVIGEATSINGKVIHLVGMKIDKNVKNNPGQTVTSPRDIHRAYGGPRLGSYSDTTFRI